MRNDGTETIHYDSTVRKLNTDGVEVISSYVDPGETLIENGYEPPTEPDGE